MPKGKVAADPLNRRWRPTPRALVLTDERVLDLTPKARLVLMLLFAACDDAGRFSAHARALAQRIGWEGRDLRRLLLELQRAGLVDLYEIDGRRFGELADYEAHVQVRMSWGYHPTYPARPPELSEIDGWPPAAMRGGSAPTETGNGSPEGGPAPEEASPAGWEDPTGGRGTPPTPSPMPPVQIRDGGEGVPPPPPPTPTPLSRGQREKRKEEREKRQEGSSIANTLTRERPPTPPPVQASPTQRPPNAPAAASRLSLAPPVELSPEGEAAVARWLERAAMECPQMLIADAQVIGVAAEHGEEALVEGIERHLAEPQGSKFWVRFPLGGLRNQAKWAAEAEAKKGAKEKAARERRQASQGDSSRAPVAEVMAQMAREMTVAEDHRQALAHAAQSDGWQAALSALEQSCTRTDFQSWFRPMGLDASTASHVALVAPDMTHAMILDDAWREQLLAALGAGWRRVTCRAAGSDTVIWEAAR